jgi:dTDP-glucose pyrophosphorylase
MGIVNLTLANKTSKTSISNINQPTINKGQHDVLNCGKSTEWLNTGQNGKTKQCSTTTTTTMVEPFCP